jgi:hypothetical protein
LFGSVGGVNAVEVAAEYTVTLGVEAFNRFPV